jgi:hypothetical protein
MRKFVVAFLGLCLLCLVSGCGGGSTSVERPAHPKPPPSGKDAIPVSAHGSAAQAAPAPNAATAPKGQK